MQIGFRMRGKGRDQQTDMQRLGRLLATLDELEAGLLSERFGLQQRYESAADSAAFAQQYYEDEAQDAWLPDQIEGLAQSLKDYARRMEALQRQLELIGRLRASTRAFAEDSGLQHVSRSNAFQAHH